MGSLAQYLHAAPWRDWFAASAAEFHTTAFWLAVLQIVFADLLLSGDNAVIIALACRGLPEHQRRWGIILGAGVAVLPTLVGERDPALTRLPGSDAPPDTGLWLVTWPDLRRNPTIQTVMAFLADCIREDPLLRADERSHLE